MFLLLLHVPFLSTLDDTVALHLPQSIAILVYNAEIAKGYIIVPNHAFLDRRVQSRFI